MTMRFAATVTALVAVLAAAAESRQTTVRTVVHGVRVDAFVTEGGRPVTGLHATDFEVLDAGLPQQVDVAIQAEHIALALVLDTSGSVRAPGFDAVTRASDSIVQSLGPTDVAAVVTVSDRLTSTCPLTRSIGDVRTALAAAARLSAGTVARSTVWDAVFGAAALVARDDGRPEVLLMSDGLDNASWLPRDQVARTLSELGVAVDFVRTPSRRGSADGAAAGLVSPEELAQATGGHAYDISDTKLAQKLAVRFADLRQAYVLTFQPRGVATGDGWHALTVRVRGRHAIVKARAGYHAGGG